MRPSIYGAPLKPSVYAVYLYFWDRSEKQKTCYPSIGTIAKDLRLSVSTGRRCIKDLEQKGYIVREARYRENKGNSSNLYTLIEE